MVIISLTISFVEVHNGMLSHMLYETKLDDLMIELREQGEYEEDGQKGMRGSSLDIEKAMLAEIMQNRKNDEQKVTEKDIIIQRLNSNVEGFNQIFNVNIML